MGSLFKKQSEQSSGGTGTTQINNFTGEGSTVRTGPDNAPNIVGNPEFNHMSERAVASQVHNGTQQQPNSVGRKIFHFEYHDQTDTRNVFDLSTSGPVTLGGVELTSRVYYKSNLDGGLFPLKLGGAGSDGYTITETGTNSYRVTLNTSLDLGANRLTIRLIGSEDSDNDVLLVTSNTGYDNASTGEGPMTDIVGAHHTDLGNSGGHNRLSFGSYGELLEGTQYSDVGGYGNIGRDLTYGYVRGAFNDVGGVRSYCIGNNNRFNANGINCLANNVYFYPVQKSLHKSTTLYGERPLPMMPGSIVVGAGRGTDARGGMVQTAQYVAREVKAGTGTGSLKTLIGSGTIEMPFSSVITIKATIQAWSRDRANGAVFEVIAAIGRGETGAPTITAQTTTQLLAWGTGGATTCAIQPSTNGFYPRFNGEGTQEYIWTGDIKLIQSATDLT